MVGNRAVVRVVKQQTVMTFFLPVLAYSPNQLVLVPFVDYDKVRPLQYPVEVEPVDLIRLSFQQGIHLPELPDGNLPLFSHQVAEAPAPLRLIHIHPMPLRHQVGDYAPEKMGVPVIPVGYDRVIKHYNTHYIFLSAAGGRRFMLVITQSNGATEKSIDQPEPVCPSRQSTFCFSCRIYLSCSVAPFQMLFPAFIPLPATEAGGRVKGK